MEIIIIICMCHFVFVLTHVTAVRLILRDIGDTQSFYCKQFVEFIVI